MPSRVQLALNVGDIDEAVAFYTKLLGVDPAKRRPGYANFALDDPSLKLVLIEDGGMPGSLNHLGIEVPDSRDVVAATDRLRRHGIDARTEERVDCCYAVQDKVWVQDQDGAAWEVYTVLSDSANREAQACC